MLLFYIFLVCFIVQLDFGLLFLLRGGRRAPYAATDVEDGVSVIICARNEAENLQQNLPVILAQRHSRFEVIVVNDASEDNTQAVLAALRLQHEHLKVINQTDGGTGKKRLIAAAAVVATYEKLLFTDADCTPATSSWVSLMTAPLRGSVEIVAGYGGYFRRAGLLNAFTRWETLHTWLQLCVLARGGAPYMAVGRNLACKKHALQRAMNDPMWDVLPQGDDDMLIRSVATKENYLIQDHPDSFTATEAKATWREWYIQKQRHMSTGKYYRLHVKLLLGAYAFSHAAGWMVFLLLLLFTPAAGVVLCIWGARCAFQWAALAKAARAVGENQLIPLFPLFDIGWLMYNFALLPYITWKNKTDWT